MIHDSELGPDLALRPELRTDWAPFEMIRPIAKDGQFRVSLSLIGQAEIHLDDIEIRRLPAANTDSQGPVRFTANPNPPTGETVPAEPR
jgi:histidinol-phosphate/aromatic aminotransferase/cobyric acid decarboxylase-like protein